MKRAERAGKWVIDRLVGLAGSFGSRANAPELSRVRQVLVVRPHNQMGDMLLGTPLFGALRQALPEARTTLVASPDNWEVMVAHPDVDELLVFDKKRFQRRPAEALAFWRSLRRVRWDLVIVPTTVSFSVTSALIARAAGGRLRIGSDGSAYGRTMGRALFDVHVPCRWDGEHQTDRNLDFVRALGIPASTRCPTMGLTSDETGWARQRVDGWRRRGSRLVGLHPGAGKLPNRWPIEAFVEAARILAADPLNHVLIMVGPREADLEAVMRRGLGRSATYLSGLPLRRAAALIDQFDVLLCNDTGVMHVAAALRTPTVALFGPTNPQLWAPLSPATRVLRGAGNRISSLEVGTVVESVSQMLGEASHASESTRF